MLTLSVRLIRNFEHRSIKQFVVKIDDPQEEGEGKAALTVQDLLDLIRAQLDQRKAELPPPFRAFKFDTLKVGTSVKVDFIGI